MILVGGVSPFHEPQFDKVELASFKEMMMDLALFKKRGLTDREKFLYITKALLSPEIFNSKGFEDIFINSGLSSQSKTLSILTAVKTDNNIFKQFSYNRTIATYIKSIIGEVEPPRSQRDFAIITAKMTLDIGIFSYASKIGPMAWWKCYLSNQILVGGSRPSIRDLIYGLLYFGASVDEEIAAETTALMLAAKNGNKKLVQFFVDLGASLDKQDNEGQTALMLAKDHPECVRIIEEAMVERSFPTR
jgi:hypothetical protein